jgi:L-threonylcarbamoyladenylate synthase
LKNTKLLTDNIDDIKIAADIIKSGGTVIFPTETVYGLGANALDANAVNQIFIAKGRPSDNPLIVHIDSFDKISKYVTMITDNAKKLAEAYWPGPMTLILEKKDIIPDIVSAGLSTVGIRVPNNEIARKFIELSEVPIAAPSANISGSPSPTSVKHVIKDMNGKVDAIIKGNDCDVGVESTVIDVTGDIPVILRPGGITPEMIKKVCKAVITDKGVNGTTDNSKPKSPGMKYKHYSPNCKIILIEDNNEEKIADKIIKKAEELSNTQLVILSTLQNEDRYIGFNTICLGDRNRPDTIAHNLFEAFRKCDELGYEVAVMEGIEENGIGIAVMNRARRAAK